jgi:RHS repeat-associated protein
VLGQTGTIENSYLFAGEQFDASLDQYYLRARYYDPSSGRFTQQDTWMGRNHDPITLHKYLYANVDPANVIDPSGQFGLASLGSTLNILGNIMTTVSTVHSVFQIATGNQKAPTAKQIGSEILFNMLGAKAFKIIGYFGKKVADRFRKLGCGNNSFVEGTLVHTESGMTPIEDVSIGDKVWATNEITGEIELKPVTHLIQGEREYDLASITFDSGEIVTATLEHPFFANGEWVDAGDLLVGDEVLLLETAKSSRIRDIEIRTSVEAVFNLTVDGFHTYHVGDYGYLVHNSNDCVIDPATHNLELVSPNLAKKIRGYPLDTHVYLGFNGSGDVVYVGISGDVGTRRRQHLADGRSFRVMQISKVKLQRPLARAIEQAIIVKYGLGKHSGQLENKINSISELRDWYDEALKWGNKWIKNNGY